MSDRTYKLELSREEIATLRCALLTDIEASRNNRRESKDDASVVFWTGELVNSQKMHSRISDLLTAAILADRKDARNV